MHFKGIIRGRVAIEFEILPVQEKVSDKKNKYVRARDIAATRYSQYQTKKLRILANIKQTKSE